MMKHVSLDVSEHVKGMAGQSRSRVSDMRFLQTHRQRVHTVS
jgi:hypothetical protein